MKASDRLNIGNQDVWTKIEHNLDRLLHKFKTRELMTSLSIMENVDGRMTENFFHKLMTIMPVHVDALGQYDLIRLLEICKKRNFCIF